MLQQGEPKIINAYPYELKCNDTLNWYEMKMFNVESQMTF